MMGPNLFILAPGTCLADSISQLVLLSVQFSSLAQSCPTLCNPIDCSTPGFPVFHHLWKFAQTHVLWVGDAIQPSHPMSYPSPPAFHLSQHQGLFQWVGSLHQVAKVLELQHQSFQWMNVLGNWLVWFPCSTKDSQESSPAPQFESISSLGLSLLHGPTLTPIHDTIVQWWGRVLILLLNLIRIFEFFYRN